MKSIITKFGFAILLAFMSLIAVNTAYSQVPDAINFQAIARDVNGEVMANTNIQLRLTILDAAADGTEIYQELRALTTNNFGSFSFQIGRNANYVTIGSFEAIDWANDSKFLKIDYDPTNTFTFDLTLGTIEFVSVPYAFAAGDVTYIDLTGVQDGDILVYNETTGKFEPEQQTATNVEWDAVQNKPDFATVSTTGDYNDLINTPIIPTVPENVSEFTNDAGYLTSFTEVDGSVTNELQTLSISNDTLYLSNGGFVKLPASTGATLLPPTATTQAATDLQITTATLNGTVNANGLSTIVTFEWGLTTAYGSNATATQSPVTGIIDVAVSANLTGLQGNTTYHYRIKATNAVNITYSSDMQFTTTWPNVPTVSTSNFSDVKGNSAKAGGSVTNNGGSAITAQGLCWSTSPNPTTANGVNTSFTDVMSVLSPNTVYYVRAYATNLAGTGYGNEISFNSGYVMGSTFGGGLVFYNDGAAHGLVCAPTDQSTGAEWGCFGTAIGGTLTAINTGAANTNTIVLGCTTAGIAARLCYDLVLSTYTDWYLPSKYELNLMYVNLHTQSFGGFASNSYWSSSEYNGNNAWLQVFNDGNQDYFNKYDSNYVRAVRAF